MEQAKIVMQALVKGNEDICASWWSNRTVTTQRFIRSDFHGATSIMPMQDGVWHVWSEIYLRPLVTDWDALPRDLYESVKQFKPTE